MSPLRQRLLRAIAASCPPAALFAACTEPARPPAHEPSPAASPAALATTTPGARPTASTPATSPTTAPASSAATREAPPWKCNPGEGDCGCFAPFSSMHSSGLTAGPARPFKHTYDASGCAPLAEVTNDCCNGAIEGPALRGGQCCYRFQTGSCCGRPLLLGGQPTLASLRQRADWASPG